VITKTCACGLEFQVPPCKAERSRFCSRSCAAKAMSERLRGNTFGAGRRPTNAFAPEHSPWNKGLKGIHLSPATEFKPGRKSEAALPLGSVTIRRHKDDGPRAWVKVAEPDVWRHRAIVVWEQAHGALLEGQIVHHKNRNTLDDALENIEAVDRAGHLAEHRHEFEAKRARATAEARWGSRRAEGGGA